MSSRLVAARAVRGHGHDPGCGPTCLQHPAPAMRTWPEHCVWKPGLDPVGQGRGAVPHRVREGGHGPHERAAQPAAAGGQDGGGARAHAAPGREPGGGVGGWRRRTQVLLMLKQQTVIPSSFPVASPPPRPSHLYASLSTASITGFACLPTASSPLSFCKAPLTLLPLLPTLTLHSRY